MASNLKMLHKLLLELTPESEKAQINAVFELLKTNPVEQALSSCHQLAKLIRFDASQGHNSTINGLITGIALAHASYDPRIIALLEGYFKQCDANRGENVVDFLQRKIK